MDRLIQRTFRITGGRMTNLPWFPRIGTRNDLAKLFAVAGFREGVEVGTFYGGYAAVLCAANPELHLTCVDPWKAYCDGLANPDQEREERIYASAMRTLSKYNTTIIRKESMEAVGDFADESLDFVYIDGNHSFDYVMLDILHWIKKVKVGGVFSAHDYHTQGGNGIRFAIDAYTRAHDIRPWYVTREELPTAFWVKK